MYIFIRKIVYFLYFLKSAKYNELYENTKIVSGQKKVSVTSVIKDFIISSFKYESSFEDYFDLRFFDIGANKRKEYATTGVMKKYHSKKNKSSKIEYFRNKYIFSKKFSSFTKRSFLYLDGSSNTEIREWLNVNQSFIAKPLAGQVGKGIEKLNTWDFESHDLLICYLKKYNLSLLEEIIVQHEKLKSLNPTSVNTVRIMTDLQNDRIRILGASLRIGMGGIVDNMAAGGIAAPVNPKTGIVCGSAVSKNVQKTTYDTHPITGVAILGIEIPYWEDIIKMVNRAALVIPEVGSVGWDVAITPSGPVIIEGNDNWDKVLWQTPHNKGLKYLLNTK